MVLDEAGAFPYQVVVRGPTNNPIPNANVMLDFRATSGVVLCPLTDPDNDRVVTQLTSTTGVAQFVLRGGRSTLLGNLTVPVYADGVLLCTAQVRCLDLNGTLSVDSLDMAIHTSLGSGALVGDYNCDGVTTAADRVVLSAALGTLCAPTFLTNPAFYQVDFFGSQAPRINDTDWGAMDVTLLPRPEHIEYFLNLVVRRNASSPAQWVVRNMMLLAPDELTDTTVVRHYFSLAGVRVAPGPIPSLEYAILLGSLPQATAPTPTSFTSAPLLDDHFDASGFYEVGDVPQTHVPPPPEPGTPVITGPPVLQEKVRDDVPAIGEGTRECAPIAVLRSLKWLAKHGKVDFKGKTDAELTAALKAAMGWTQATGADAKQVLTGKLKLNKDLNLGLVMKFQSTHIPGDGNFKTADGIAIRKGGKSFDFMKSEFDHEEDVEVFYTHFERVDPPEGIMGHAATVIAVKLNENGEMGIMVQDDKVQGDDDPDNEKVYTEFGEDIKSLRSLPGSNFVRMFLSESPRTKVALGVNGVAEWGDGVSLQDPLQITIPADGKPVRFAWTIGDYLGGEEIYEHPQYEPYTEKNETGTPIERKIQVPDDPSITDWVLRDANGAVLRGASIRRGSPWRFHPLADLPHVGRRVPVLAPVSPDTNDVIDVAVDLPTYIANNRLGFQGGQWHIGQTLAQLGVSVVHGRIPGVEGIYFATAPFVFDSNSATGWVPRDTTRWLDSSTYPWPIKIVSSVESGPLPVDVPTPRGMKGFLRDAVPNPFEQRTTLRFRLPGPGRVRLAVFDVRGRLVRVLSEALYPAGDHEVDWDGRDRRGRLVPSGVYFARLLVGSDDSRARIVFLGGKQD